MSEKQEIKEEKKENKRQVTNCAISLSERGASETRRKKGNDFFFCNLKETLGSGLKLFQDLSLTVLHSSILS